MLSARKARLSIFADVTLRQGRRQAIFNKAIYENEVPEKIALDKAVPTKRPSMRSTML